VVNGNVLDVELLLDASCSIDVADSKGRSPLACAMIFGRHDMAQHLLLRGASPKATNLRGETTVFLASRFGHTAPLEKVRSHLEGLAPDQQTFKSLIIQQEQTNGKSCLWVAAQFGHVDVAQVTIYYVL
jgi:ankyrin repeat protein